MDQIELPEHLLQIIEEFDNEATKFKKEIKTITEEILGHEGNDKEIKPTKEKIKINSRSLGLVLYGETQVYSENKNQNKKIHLGFKPEQISIMLTKFFGELTKIKIEKIVVGHEHGDKNFKCHFQCFIKFCGCVRLTLEPFILVDSQPQNNIQHQIKLLGLYQTARKPKALELYCKKEGDFFESKDLALSKRPDGRANTVYDTLYNEPELTAKEVIQLLGKENPKDLFNWGDKILKNYEEFVHDECLPDFEWQPFPEHLNKKIKLLEDYFFGNMVDILSEEDIEEYKAYRMIKNWYLEQCVNGKEGRKKALLIYSKKRGLGKTQFAKNLVNDERYIIHEKTSFDGKLFKKQEDTAKLLVIDDVLYKKEQFELWKGLVASEPVRLDTKYCNERFKHGIPCIILTNSDIMLEKFYESTNFNTQITLVEINQYLGPEGTYPNYLTVESCISLATQLRFDERKRRRTTNLNN